MSGTKTSTFQQSLHSTKCVTVGLGFCEHCGICTLRELRSGLQMSAHRPYLCHRDQSICQTLWGCRLLLPPPLDPRGNPKLRGLSHASQADVSAPPEKCWGSGHSWLPSGHHACRHFKGTSGLELISRHWSWQLGVRVSHLMIFLIKFNFFL